ncbi:MAG: uroporphyrinogen decarboxylase family protein, partial [Anaerolineae bacterium]|nr:uroporphyrinogen decarboxylase family protein [Anaerolineae bacterium]
MDARTRVLTALDGETPDRIPCALGFYPIDLSHRFPPGISIAGQVDATFVHFATTPAEEAWRSAARHSPDDTRLGTFSQITNYRQWSYQPQMVTQRNPLARARSLDELASFPFPAIEVTDRIAQLSCEVDIYHAQDMAVGSNLPHLGGELFEAAWRLRGLENFLLDLVERPAWAHLLLDRLTEMACRYAGAAAEAGVDMIALGDDVGMPGTMIIGPDCWRTFFKPRMAEIIRAA